MKKRAIPWRVVAGIAFLYSCLVLHVVCSVSFIDFFSALHGFAPGDLGNPIRLVQGRLFALVPAVSGAIISLSFLIAHVSSLSLTGRNTPGTIRNHSILTMIIACIATGPVLIILDTWATLSAFAAGSSWFHDTFWVTSSSMLVVPFSTSVGMMASIIIAWFVIRAHFRATRDSEYNTCWICGKVSGGGIRSGRIKCLACGQHACRLCVAAWLCKSDLDRLAPAQKRLVLRLGSGNKVLYVLLYIFNGIVANLLSSLAFPSNILARYSSWILMSVIASVGGFIVYRILQRRITRIAGKIA